MEKSNFFDNIEYKDNKPAVKLIYKSSFTKEIRILMHEGQTMKEHQTPYPILIHVLTGNITFGVNGAKSEMKEGDIISLEGSVPHDLYANTDSMVRLTLVTNDHTSRVDKVSQE